MFRISSKVYTILFFTVLILISSVSMVAKAANTYTPGTSSVDLYFTDGLNSSITVSDTWSSGYGFYDSSHNGVNVYSVAPIGISDPNVGLAVIGSSYSSLSNSTGSIPGNTGATYAVVMSSDLTTFTVTLKSLTTAITDDSFTLYYDSTGFGTANTALTVNVHINFTVSISPTTLTSGTVGTSYSKTFSSSGGIPSYTYAVTSGSLPAGLSLSSGALSGTPTKDGTYSFTVTSTDSIGYTGSQTYSLTIAAPTITLTPGTLIPATVGSPYSTNFSASGGISPYTYSATTLPAGLSLNSTTGTLSGTPSLGGSYLFTVTATDGSGNNYTGMHAYSLTINSPPSAPTLSGNTGTVGTSFSATLSASGATSYTLTSGSLPDGLSLNTSTGAISGTPTKAGDYNCVFTATNTTGPSAPSPCTFTIAAPTITLSPTTLSSGTVGTSYFTTVFASGGIPSYTYAVTSGSLPGGLTLSSAGVLSGTLTASDLGTFSFTITATDSSGHNYTGSNSYSLTILTAPSAPTLSGNTGTVGTSFSAALSASGSPTSYALAAGSLPNGLSLNASTGAISGTPTKAGTYPCTFTATNSAGTSAVSPVYTFTIATPTITLSPAALTSGTVGTPSSTTISASGGISPYSYTVTSGALPPGLTLNPTGVISGTSTAIGTFSFTITATDSSGNSYTGSQAYTLAIFAVPSAPTLSGYTGTVGTSFSSALSASGSPTSYALASGSLPNGLSLNIGTGVISGTPTKAGTYPCSFTATNNAGTSAISPAYTFTIAAPTIALSPVSAVLTSGKVGTLYSTTFTASGGISPYSYTVTSGTLPSGLSLSTAGVLSGTPIAAGTYSFTITATDSSSYTVSQPYTVTVTLAAPTAANKAVKVLANSTSNPIDMSDSISGTYTSISVVNQPSHGSAVVSGNIIDYVPAQGYSGSDSFSYTATGPGGTSAAATISVTVLARSDPSKDKEVTGILSSQASMAKSFGTTQISNIQGHLESLHSSQTAVNNGDRSVERKRRHTLNLLGNNEGNTAYKPTTLSYNTANTTPTTKTLPLLGLNFTGKPDTQGFSWWSSGSIQIGRSKSESDKISSTSIRTNGITLGVDRQINPLFTFGGAINWGKQYNEIGDNGSKVDGNNRGIALYSSWHPQKGNYWDIIMGYQTLNFHNDRYITDSNGIATSDRHGSQWYASVISGHETTDKQKLIGVYSRLTTIQTHLDETSENNSGIYALTYAGQTVKSLNWAAGLRMEWPGKKITPKTRIEYQHEFQDTGSAYVAYNDDLSTWYQIAPQEYGKNVLNTEFGFDWAVSKHEKIELLYAWHSYFSGNKFGYFSWKYRYQY